MLRMGEIRVVQISDPHFKDRADATARFRAFVELSNRRKADLALLEGDYTGNDRAKDLKKYAKNPDQFEQLSADVYQVRKQLSQKAGRILSEEETLEMIVQQQPEYKQPLQEYREDKKRVNEGFKKNSRELAEIVNIEAAKIKGKFAHQLGNHDPEFINGIITNGHSLYSDGILEIKGVKFGGDPDTYELLPLVDEELFPHLSDVNDTWKYKKNELDTHEKIENYKKNSKTYQRYEKVDVLTAHKVVDDNIVEGRKGDYGTAHKLIVENAKKKGRKIISVGGHIHDGGGISNLDGHFALRSGPNYAFEYVIDTNTKEIKEVIVYKLVRYDDKQYKKAA